MQFSVKKMLPHLFVLVGFVILSLAYFNPVLKGKQIFQSDIIQYTGMAKQQNDFRDQTTKETYWTNSAFGGMPTYQLGAHYPHNYIKKLDLLIRFLPRPADYLFLYFIGFYILLLVLKADYRLAVFGALAFGFSTYLIIILGVGHNSKAHAIAYMPLVLSGILLTFQRKFITGFLLTTIAMALELVANHFQMTYYLMLLVVVLGIAYFIDSYKQKKLSYFFKSVAILITAVILAIGLNATNILATQEYVKESTRGKSELTINPDSSVKEITSGLDKVYITEFSYGILESFNLFIPRFMGGGSYEDVGKDSNTYDALRKMGVPPVQALQEVKHTPTYWGNQPIVEAPAYIGAVILFLFIFALFLVKGRLKWWLVGGVLLSLLLSFGKNFPFGFITDFFIDYVPFYNKFRAVSSIQVILELCIPLLAVFGLAKLFSKVEKEKAKLKALKYSAIITTGLALLFLLFGSSLFDFVGNNDGRYIQGYGQAYVDAVKEDRRIFFTADTIRTLILVLLSATIIWMYLKKKLSQHLVVLIFAIIIVLDLVVVDRRYVNNKDFVSSIQVKKPYQANEADLEILKDKSHYRVFDLTSGNTKASYFHNSLNGYHAAKMRRYNDLFDFYISKNHLQVLNMLNTKYIIGQSDNGKPIAYTNPDSNGNAWFVEELKHINSANEEIIALDSLNTRSKAIYSILSFTEQKSLSYKFEIDSLVSINLVEHKPNYLKYESRNQYDGFAVFSENYYGQGWQAYIDGEEVDHIRVNYVLRGMEIPAGNHTIEYKFEPQVIKTGSFIVLGSTILLALLLIGGLFYKLRRK